MARVSRNNIALNFEQVQNKINKKIYKVALYLRLSEEDKRSIDVYSIGNQRKICMDYMADRDDMILSKTFIDNGFTGANFNREGFQNLMQAVAVGEVDCVIVKDISRFGRNYIEVGKYVDVEFPKHNIRFVSINDNYDSNDEQCSNTQLMLRFKNIINDNYVKDYSVKIRSTITAKMDSGTFLPSLTSMTYGYEKDVDNNTYTIDEDLQDIIIYIFEMRGAGEKFNHIAKELKAKNIPSPGKLRYLKGYTTDKRMENAQWNRTTIRKITKDITYLGHRVHGKIKSDAVGEKKSKRPQDEWQIIEHAHPAIIPEELFKLVQEVNENELAKRETMNKQDDVAFECRPLLADKVFCGDCGAKMQAIKQISRANKLKSRLPNFVYYNCSQYGKTDRQKCSSHYIKGEVIVGHMVKSLQAQVQLVADIKDLIKQLKTTKNKVNGKVADKIAMAKKQNEEFRIRLLQDYMDNILDKEEYLYAKVKYEKLYEDLTIEEEIIDQQSKEASAMLAVADDILASTLQFTKTKELDRKMVELLIDKVEIFEAGNIKITFAFKNLFAKPLNIQGSKVV